MKIEMFLAMTTDRGIACKCGLPWKSLKDYMNWFKRITNNKTIIVGRKTYEAMKPFDTKCIVLTRNPVKFKPVENVKFADYTDDLIDNLDGKVVVIGGNSIFRLFQNKVSVINLTTVDIPSTHCDTFIDKEFNKNFKVMYGPEKHTDKDINYEFSILRKFQSSV